MPSLSFSIIIGSPPERDEIQNLLKSFLSVSPAPCKQTEGAFRAGESVVKALICRSHAARQTRTKTRPKTHTHTHLHTAARLAAAKHGTYLAKWDSLFQVVPYIKVAISLNLLHQQHAGTFTHGSPFTANCMYSSSVPKGVFPRFFWELNFFLNLQRK